MRILATSVAFAVLVAASASAPSPPASPAPFLDWEVASRRPHDTTASTQGLLLDADGRLFESTGRWGESTLREVDAVSGEVLRSLALPADLFGEGLALVDDRLIQLTYKAGLAFVRDASTFELLDAFAYDGEGWGLCFDGERLVMSDGSDRLVLRDPGSFEVTGEMAVTLDGEPLLAINELECVDGFVWANVFGADTIVRIDARDGRVTGVLDLGGVLEPHPATASANDVLNGIAYDPAADTFLVTGKRWPELIEIRVLAPDAGASARAETGSRASLPAG